MSVRNPLKWYHDALGDVSFMRIVAMWGACVGTTLCIAGIFAMFFNIDSATTAMMTGAGLFSIGELAKAFQAQKGL